VKSLFFPKHLYVVKGNSFEENSRSEVAAAGKTMISTFFSVKERGTFITISSESISLNSLITCIFNSLFNNMEYFFGFVKSFVDQARILMRCEPDAAYFHLYGISTPDVDYIMDTFPIVKRKDQTKYGSYRTKEKILEIYEKMSTAITDKKPYETALDSPPAVPSVAHPKEQIPKTGKD
jgi:hypothetical protein